MVRVVFKNGKTMEVPEAVDVLGRAGVLVLRDWDGLELVGLNQEDVESFVIEGAEPQQPPAAEAAPRRRYVRREPRRRRS
jgi:hypothetical protein